MEKMPKVSPGEGLSREKAEEATKRLSIEHSEKALQEAAKGVREMLEKGYDLNEILESIKREVGENDNKRNLH